MLTWASGPGNPGWVLGFTLTHRVASLMHGPHGAPSLHAAAQSPALLQVLKGQRSQVTRSELEPQERWEGQQRPKRGGAAGGMGVR